MLLQGTPDIMYMIQQKTRENPDPKTLDHDPLTPDPQPMTPKLVTRNRTHHTLHGQPVTLHP